MIHRSSAELSARGLGRLAAVMTEPLDALLRLPGVTDVLVNAPDSVWIDRGFGLERVAASFADDRDVRRLARRLAMASGRRLDDAQPFVDSALPDGTRLHAMLPPLVASTTVSLRVLRTDRFDLDTLQRLGMFPAPVAELLREMVHARLAVLISGGTGTGKTTLLGAMLGAVDPSERIVIIEDAPELVVTHEHVVRLTSRSHNVEGAGAIEQRDLVRQSLRMRPDRIVVGEFRGAEIVDLLVALNTGHDGGAATVHANSAADVPARCVALGGLAGFGPGVVTGLLVTAIDALIALRRVGGTRIVDEIAMLTSNEAGGVDVSAAWTRRRGVHEPGARVLRDLMRERSGAVPYLLW